MKTTLTALAALLAPSLVFAGTWQSDYAQALKVAKSADKPVFVYFSDNGVAPSQDPKLAGKEALLDRFVPLYADRNTAEGQKLYKLFDIASLDAAVVVDRSQKWQFCRYERELSPAELVTMLEKTATADGKPTTEVLQPASSTTAEANGANVGNGTRLYYNADQGGAVQGGTVIMDSFSCPSCSRR